MRMFVFAAILALSSSAPALAQRFQQPSHHETDSFDWRHAEYLVTLMYEAALFREPDAQGLYGWSRHIVQHGYQGLLDVASGIGGSAEFHNGVCSRYSTDDIIDNLYWVFFNREPDWSGRNAWGNLLRQGRGAEALRGIVGSEEFYNHHIRSNF